MEQIVVKGIEVKFSDLTEEKQEELYEQKREEFEKEAANSWYETIRQKVIESTTSKDILDTIFTLEVENYGSIKNIEALWKHPKLKKTAEKRKILAGSDDWEIRLIAAKDEECSSKFLNEMLRKEAEGEYDSDVVKAIQSNPKFQIEQKTLKVLSESDNWRMRLIAAKDEKCSSKFLNQMLQKEVEGEHDKSVVEAILYNPKFQMEEESLRVFSKSKDWIYRQMVAEDEKCSSEILNEMLRKEVEGKHDEDIMEVIQNNPKFQMEEESLEVLSESENWRDRLIAAKDEKCSSEILNEMLRKEVEGEHDRDVMEAIQNNPKFQIEEESLEVLSESENWRERLIAAKDEKCSSKFLNEMLQKEVEVEGEYNKAVIEAIFDNPNFQMEKENLQVLQVLTKIILKKIEF